MKRTKYICDYLFNRPKLSIKDIEKIVKETPNDMELGDKIRQMIKRNEIIR